MKMLLSILFLLVLVILIRNKIIIQNINIIIEIKYHIFKVKCAYLLNMMIKMLTQIFQSNAQ